VHQLPADDGSTRAELVERLVQHLSDPEHLVQVLQALTDAQRRALMEVGAAGGQTRGFLLARKHGDVLDDLLARGLLFRTFTAAGPRRGELFAAPDEVLELLPASPEADALAEPPPPTEAPAERRATDPAFNVFTLASFVVRQPRGLNEAAFAEEVRGWVEEPGGWPWQERWTFFRHLGQAAALFSRRADGGLALASPLPDLLSDPPALRERLWRAYMRDREWSELARASVPLGPTLAEQVDASSLRAAILNQLARLPEGAWITLDDIVDWMRRAAPIFLREQLDVRSAALTDPTSGEPLLDQPSAWSRIEAPLVRYTLLGPLYWLGVVATSPTGDRVALTRAGSGLLRTQTAEILARPSEPCVWQADGRLLAPPRADLGALLQAERYLVLEERGRPSRYRLERERVAVALAVGGSVDECRELLERLCEAHLPAQVGADLDTWGERFGALALRPAVLLDARSEADLEAVATLRGVRTLIKRRLGPSAAEVAASDALEVASALRSAGHLPRVDAALWLMAGRRAYAGLVDEQVLEFLLVSLLAFQRARPEQLAELEGAPSLIERLEGLFPGERLAALRTAADRLAGDIPSPRPSPRGRGKWRSASPRGRGRAQRG
jgi:hypothetical protein